MKLIVDQVTIENTSDGGYCIVQCMEEGGGRWLELYGNEVKPAYPLNLESHDEINIFCEKLHILLDGKLLPTGFIKE